MTTQHSLSALPPPLSTFKREPFLYPHASPISSLPRLTSHLTSPSNKFNPKFWIKHEDSNSGLAGSGGNKIRKLEYIIADALEKNATVLVTTGGLQSNHMRQVAAAGARCGLKTHLIPNDIVKSSDPEYRSVGNIQLTHLLSAEHAPYNSDPEEVMAALTARGDKPYWIPSGGSAHPLGGLGYARFAFEIAEQEAEMSIFFDVIIVACASGSTLGGMVAGFKLLESLGGEPGKAKRTLIGVDAFASEPGKSRKTVLQIARTTTEALGLPGLAVSDQDVVIDERWNAGSYGFVDERTREAMKLLAGLEGILTDPVYTGKALAGMIEMARMGELEGKENVLFVHTGGVAALSAYPNVR